MYFVNNYNVQDSANLTAKRKFMVTTGNAGYNLSNDIRTFLLLSTRTVDDEALPRYEEIFYIFNKNN